MPGGYGDRDAPHEVRTPSSSIDPRGHSVVWKRQTSSSFRSKPALNQGLPLISLAALVANRLLARIGARRDIQSSDYSARKRYSNRSAQSYRCAAVEAVEAPESRRGNRSIARRDDGFERVPLRFLPELREALLAAAGRPRGPGALRDRRDGALRPKLLHAGLRRAHREGEFEDRHPAEGLAGLRRRDQRVDAPRVHDAHAAPGPRIDAEVRRRDARLRAGRVGWGVARVGRRRV